MASSTLKTITISLPFAMGKQIEKAAKEEHRTVSELLREAFRQHQAKRNLAALTKETKKVVKKKKLTPSRSVTKRTIFPAQSERS